MKILSIAIAAILVLAISSARGQTDYSARKATSRLTIGVGASLGIAVGTGTIDSTLEAAPGVAYRFGLNAQYPVNRVIGILLAAGLEGRSVGVKVNEQLDTRVYSARYLYIEPAMSWSSFKLGVNIGLPMGGTEPVNTPYDSAFSETTRDMADKALGMIIEPRLGASLVLIEERGWWLGLTIDVGLPITSFYDESYRASTAGLMEEDIPNTRLLNGHLGLTYQFAIPGVLGR